MAKGFITVSDHKRICRIPVSDIVRVQSNGMCTTVHTESGEQYTQGCNMKVIASQLEASGIFFKVHRSYMINLRKIKEYRKVDGGTVVMADGTEISIARRRRANFLEAYRGF